MTDLKDDFQARALRITDLSQKHTKGTHPHDVIEISFGNSILYLNGVALEKLRSKDFDWHWLKLAIQALPADPFTNDL